MYVVPPPQRSDPGSRSTGGSTDLRVYQTWKGSNVSPVSRFHSLRFASFFFLFFFSLRLLLGLSRFCYRLAIFCFRASYVSLGCSSIGDYCCFCTCPGTLFDLKDVVIQEGDGLVSAKE